MTILSKAAVFYDSDRPLVLEELPVPVTLENGAVLCKVRCSTICGSDIHTIRGRRNEPAPLILGHEICGEIVATGGEVTDMNGERLHEGDVISWSIMASCGQCFFCARGLEQKCLSLKKYGHTNIGEYPGLTGGFAEYAYLFPGTAIVKVPSTIPDTVAATVNCALATAVHCVNQSIGDDTEAVLVLGAGLLGIYCIAYLKSCGVPMVVSADVQAARLETASRFGASRCFDLSRGSVCDMREELRAVSGPHGFDTVIEVCGNADALALGYEAARTGGIVLTAGLVVPGSSFAIDPNMFIRRNLTLRGSHNYPPSALKTGVAFLARSIDDAPYREITGATYSLDAINEAIDVAETGRFLRVGIVN